MDILVGKQSDGAQNASLTEGNLFIGQIVGGESLRGSDVLDLQSRVLSDDLLRCQADPELPQDLLDSDPSALNNRLSEQDIGVGLYARMSDHCKFSGRCPTNSLPRLSEFRGHNAQFNDVVNSDAIHVDELSIVSPELANASGDLSHPGLTCQGQVSHVSVQRSFMNFVVQGARQPFAMHLQPNGVEMGRVIVPLLLAAAFLFNPGCAVNGIDGPVHNGAEAVEFVGEVIYVPVEGGFYGIISRNGRKLNPMNLHESLKRQGIALEGVYRVREDVAGIRQWGTTVELIHQNPVY